MYHAAMQEYNDALLTTFLSSMTKGTQSMLDLADKYNIAYDYKSSKRRGPSFDPGMMHG